MMHSSIISIYIFMKKIFYIIPIIFIVIIISWVWYYINQENISNEQNTATGSGEILPGIAEIKQAEKEIKKQDTQEKIQRIKKKLALKGLIVEWDIHLENHEYTIALSKFLQLQKELPDDPAILQKIGDSFFALKRFGFAYKYYHKILDFSQRDTHKTLLALLYSQPITPDSLWYFVEEISGLPLSEAEAYYYINAIACTQDISQCKKRYQDFFDSQPEADDLPDGMLSINEALENYTNFQLDDLSYKNALLVGSFYEQQMYPITILLGQQILEERPWYAPILKIVAKSYFELGDYAGAKKYLVEYNESHPNEADISFALWVVYEKLKDYIISSIHFTKSLELGYEPSVDIRRKMIYNYNALDDRQKVLSGFTELMNENSDDLEWKDYSLWIYHHIIDEQYDTAWEFITRAIEKYPENELFDGYMAWVLLEQEDSDLSVAEGHIQSGLEKNKKNAMLNLLAGRLNIAQWNNNTALIYFKKTIALDEYGDFSEQAKQYITTLQ